MAIHTALMHQDVSLLVKDTKIAIVAAEFNPEIMEGLLEKNISRFHAEGFVDVTVFRVPGCFELPAFTHKILVTEVYDMVMVLGCVVRGQTPHFDYVCTECSRGIMELSLAYDTPLIFGVLTCDTMDQAVARVDDNYAIYGLNYLAQHLQVTARVGR